MLSRALFLLLLLASAAHAEDQKRSLATEIKSRLPTVQRCYFAELEAHPTLRGKVIAHFTVQPDGTVTDVRVEDVSLHAPKVASCIETNIRLWRLAVRPETPSPVTFPFLFSPGTCAPPP